MGPPRAPVRQITPAASSGMRIGASKTWI
jgi:hypothetical protein